jgi:hypothetical protein
MNRRRHNHWMTLVQALLTVLVLVPTLFAQQQPPAKNQHAFRGKIEQIDAKAKTVTVRPSPWRERTSRGGWRR